MVPFVELKSQFCELEQDIRAAIDRVLQRSWYILGEEGANFEREFAAWIGTPHAVGVGSGTEAIHLALRAAGIGHGDEVITVANTCVPTIAAIGASGATVVLVDAHPVTLTLDPGQLPAAITARTRAIVPVHLYGHPCDMDPIMEIAQAHEITVVEDCAQAHGARYKGRVCGTLGHFGAFSFYPSKNLGAYGDGGALTTHLPEMDAALRKLRNYGEDTRYNHVVEGFNSRLDEIQAAILRAKLPHVDMWNRQRQALAARYDAALAGLPVQLPPLAEWALSNRHLYPIRSSQRDALQAFLRERGVQTLMHYPIPVHLQKAFRGLGNARGAFPVAESSCDTVLSLPLYPEMAPHAVDEVIEGVGRFFT